MTRAADWFWELEEAQRWFLHWSRVFLTNQFSEPGFSPVRTLEFSYSRVPQNTAMEMGLKLQSLWFVLHVAFLTLCCSMFLWLPHSFPDFSLNYFHQDTAFPLSWFFFVMLSVRPFYWVMLVTVLIKLRY